MFSPSGQLYRIDQVPDHFKELFIESGYRSPKSSPSQCLRSVFEATNETLNFWTHFVPAVYFWYKTYELLFLYELCWDPHMYPMLAYMICLCAFPITSAVAHVFNCLSDEARHMCFFLDYAALSLYSLGTALAYKAYVFPEHWHGTTFSEVYVPVAVFNAIISLALSCQSRFMMDSYSKKLLRLFAYSIPYLFDCIPVIYRVISSPLQELPNDMVLALQLRQFMFASLAAFLYTTHLPERLSPGSFDIVGHSHQLFHICTVLGANDQMQAIILELNKPSPFSHSLEIMATTALILIIIIAFFSWKLHLYKKQGRPIGLTPCCAQRLPSPTVGDVPKEKFS